MYGTVCVCFGPLFPVRGRGRQGDKQLRAVRPPPDQQHRVPRTALLRDHTELPPLGEFNETLTAQSMFDARTVGMVQFRQVVGFNFFFAGVDNF